MTSTIFSVWTDQHRYGSTHTSNESVVNRRVLTIRNVRIRDRQTGANGWWWYRSLVTTMTTMHRSYHSYRLAVTTMYESYRPYQLFWTIVYLRSVGVPISHENHVQIVSVVPIVLHKYVPIKAGVPTLRSIPSSIGENE